MKKVTQVAKSMQKVLKEEAIQAGWVSGLVERKSKLSADKFVQTLVFGWLANKEASLSELTQMASALGVKISAQGLDKRFSQEAADCLRLVLAKAIENLICADAAAIPVVKKFTEVRLFDSSVVTLPKELTSHWAGSRDSAVKVEVSLDLLTGTLSGPYLRDASAHDSSGKMQTSALASNSLRLADLGYFDIGRLCELNEEGVYWISRFHPKALLVTDKPYHLADFLHKQKKAQIDTEVRLGQEQLLPARLLAVRVRDKQVIKRRLKRSRRKSLSNRRARNRKLLALAHWTVYVTNAPKEILSFPEVFALARARWQIELLFKLWKSHGHIDEWRSRKPWRILCELYAKLIAMLIQHWTIIVSCWHLPDRSMVKAAQTVRKFALYLAISFNFLKKLVSALNDLVNVIISGCRINKRKKTPANFQLLLGEALG